MEQYMVIGHIIDIDVNSIGGTQSMFHQLISGLNRYSDTLNIPIDKTQIDTVDVVIHHRTAISRPIETHKPYVLINHTYANFSLVKKWKADQIVHVCEFFKQLAKNGVSILNGIDSKEIDCIPARPKDYCFNTGRCQRLTKIKFRLDSIDWLNDLDIPGHHHHIIGYSKQAEVLCKRKKNVSYYGPIQDFSEKIHLLKQLDVYVYETFAPEGASISILEALACGIPVLCFDQGGNKELVISGTNGIVCKNREEMQDTLIVFSRNPELLDYVKQVTKADFEQRLNIKHRVPEYLRIIKELV